jgi:hypothetical protein
VTLAGGPQSRCFDPAGAAAPRRHFGFNASRQGGKPDQGGKHEHPQPIAWRRHRPKRPPRESATSRHMGTPPPNPKPALSWARGWRRRAVDALAGLSLRNARPSVRRAPGLTVGSETLCGIAMLSKRARRPTSMRPFVDGQGESSAWSALGGGHAPGLRSPRPRPCGPKGTSAATIDGTMRPRPWPKEAIAIEREPRQFTKRSPSFDRHDAGILAARHHIEGWRSNPIAGCLFHGRTPWHVASSLL